MVPADPLRTAALGLNPQARAKMQAIYTPAGVQIIDEYSQLAAKIIHATALRVTYARETTHRLKREDYALARERFGRMSILVYA